MRILLIILCSFFITAYSQKNFTYNKGYAGVHYYPVKTEVGKLSLWVSIHNYINENMFEKSFTDLKISFQDKKRKQRFYYNYYLRYYYKDNTFGNFIQLRAKI